MVTRNHPSILLQVECVVPVDEPVFSSLPTSVAFVGYEPFKTYETVLRFRNNDNVRWLKGGMASHGPHAPTLRHRCRVGSK